MWQDHTSVDGKGLFFPLTGGESSGGMEMTLVRIHEEIMSAAVFS